MQIVFFCPPATVINGGIKYIFHMAESLRALGHDAVVIEEHERRPTWFESSAPIVGQSALRPNPGQVYVLPEDQTHMLAPLKDWPQQKIIFSQNHFYGAYRLEDGKSYADYGIRHVICTSHTIREYMQTRHAGVAAHLVPYAIDADLFRPAAMKQDRIAFMPRKRVIEAAYIRDMFRFLYPACRGWQWQELSNLAEADIAKALGEAKIFLSLSRLEGFGLTPLEGMAAGCIVAGFTGIGGREYALRENGFWAEEDDFPGCTTQLKAAVDLSQAAGPQGEAYKAACRKTIGAYTPDLFRRAVKETWEKILA